MLLNNCRNKKRALNVLGKQLKPSGVQNKRTYLVIENTKDQVFIGLNYFSFAGMNSPNTPQSNLS